MNKKGFTLVELIACIAILAILTGVAVISYTAFIDKAHDKVFESYIDDMHEAAIMYALSNTISNNNTKSIPLIDLGIDSINNPDDQDDKCLNSYVEAKREDKDGVISFTYKVCLICNEYNKCKDFIN